MSKVWLLVCILLFTAASAAFMLQGCSCNPREGKQNGERLARIKQNQHPDPFGKYVPPITLTAMRFFDEKNKAYPPGDSLENNVWTRAYEEKLGIKIKYLWTAATWQEFDEKVNAAIAADELPDLMPLYTTLFFRVAHAGKAADLTEVYDKHATPAVKENLSIAGEIALKSATFDGKLYGLAIPPDIYGGAELLWIRRDWLRNLKLSPPRHMNDVIRIAQAFAGQDPDGNGKRDTVGLAMHKDLYWGTASIIGFANGYHAYPYTWVEKDGKLVFGSVQPEMKTVLGNLAALYKFGAIDREFAIKNPNIELVRDFESGKIGMVYGGDWLPNWPLNLNCAKDPKADWAPFKIVSVDENPALAQIDTRVSNFLAVNFKCKHPEALIKIFNLHYELAASNNPADRIYHDQDGIDTFMLGLFYAYRPYYNIECHLKVSEALINSDVSKLNPEQRGYYEKARDYLDGADPKGWSAWRIFGPKGSQALLKEINDQNLCYYNRGCGPETQAWIEYGPLLRNKEIEYFTRIIMGAAPLTEFEKWVEYFEKHGGGKATREINKQWREQRK